MYKHCLYWHFLNKNCSLTIWLQVKVHLAKLNSSFIELVFPLIRLLRYYIESVPNKVIILAFFLHLVRKARAKSLAFSKNSFLKICFVLKKNSVEIWIMFFFQCYAQQGKKPPMNFSRRKKKLKLNLSFALTSVETKYKPTIFANIENIVILLLPLTTPHLWHSIEKKQVQFFSRQTLVDNNTTTTTYDIIKSRKNHHAVQFFKA